MKIWCRNYNCSENKKLESPVSVKFRKFYTSIGSEDNLCSGECQSKIFNFIPAGLSGMRVEYNVALCVPSKEKNVKDFICSRNDCSSNNNKKCIKNEIIVDKIIVNNEIFWICKNFSQTKVSGHVDWSKNLDSDGHPKYGGHLDDSDSERLAHDNSVFRSYSTHHRESKESNPRKVIK